MTPDVLQGLRKGWLGTADYSPAERTGDGGGDRDGHVGKVPTDGHIGVQALTYHLLVLLDDHVGVGPQEDVKIQHPPDGPPGQAWSGLQGHLFARGRERKTW